MVTESYLGGGGGGNPMMAAIASALPHSPGSVVPGTTPPRPHSYSFSSPSPAVAGTPQPPQTPTNAFASHTSPPSSTSPRGGTFQTHINSPLFATPGTPQPHVHAHTHSQSTTHNILISGGGGGNAALLRPLNSASPPTRTESGGALAGSLQAYEFALSL